MKKFCLTMIITSFFFILSAQHVYEIDASKVMLSPRENIYNFDQKGQNGKEIAVNSLYIGLRFSIMGEMQFFQINHEQWEDYLLKMKAFGVNIIDNYLI